MTSNPVQNALSPRHFLPDFCRVGPIIYIVVLTEILACLLALGSLLGTVNFWLQLTNYALFIFWVALLGAAVLCSCKRWIWDWSDLAAGSFAFGILLLITLVMSVLAIEVLPAADLLPIVNPAEKPVAYLRNLLMSGIISAVLLRYLYVQQHWRRQTQAEIEARLDALQARMRPHFLFNSLNTIACLARDNPGLCESLVEDLAELFRASIKTSGRMVPMRDELALVEKYLRIEQARLGDRLQLDWQMDQVPLDALLPPLSLQPLIENAVYHGIETMDGGGVLSIEGVLQLGKLTLTIRNPLTAPLQEKHRTGNRIAIDNIGARIRGCFPDEGKLVVWEADDAYQAQLVFPYRKAHG